MEDSVSFSIIIPIYKVEDCLRKCVDSALRQTYSNFEVLLVDDGSPDHCPEICDEYSRQDDRVRVIHKKNGGLVSARNAGVREAKGQYICYIDGDDWVDERLLEVLKRGIDEHDGPDMVVYNAFYEYKDRQEPIPTHVEYGYYDKKRLVKEIYPYMMYDPSLPFFEGKVFPAAWNKAYKRELLSAHYCREEGISCAEDNAFTFECLYYADSAVFCDDHLYHYNRCNEGSMISQYNSRYFEKSQLACRYIESRLGGKEDYLDEEINVFKAAWVIMAVFHEFRFQKSFGDACRHLKETLGRSDAPKRIHMCGLPVAVRLYMLALRLGWYHIAGLGARVLMKHTRI